MSVGVCNLKANSHLFFYIRISSLSLNLQTPMTCGFLKYVLCFKCLFLVGEKGLYKKKQKKLGFEMKNIREAGPRIVMW